jgi:formate dehydrogenase beta subunit
MNLNQAGPEAPAKSTKGRSIKPKGRHADEISRGEVRDLIAGMSEEGYRRDLLIEYLHKLNDHYRGLYERHLVALADVVNVPMAEVYEVATFYHHFEILSAGTEPALVKVRVCGGLSCEIAGSGELLERLQQSSGPSMRVVSAPCIGRCDQSPAALAGSVGVPHATEEKVLAIASSIQQLGTMEQPAADDPAFIDMERYVADGGYALVSALDRGEVDREAVLKTLENSGLRGLGGAGFPAGRKWRIVRGEAAPRLMAVNIDEGEPGTFKDRYYLERDPHRFLEGMLIAALVVGVEAIYIYLRDEYHECRIMLTRELARLKANPPCSLPRIELRRGAGAYICGEESAMLESIEGRRGEPRMRPPYIAQVGLFGRPTLEHNFETLYWVRDIATKGPTWFGSFGRLGRIGFRSFSVSGRVAIPGVKLAPAGVTLNELIEGWCGGMAPGHELYAFLPGGASGGILPARLADIPLDFDTLQPYGSFIGSAAVIVLSQQDKARDAALNMMRFFAHESCGQCTPCRVGTAKSASLMEANRWDTKTLDDLGQMMADASICGLGQAAPNPVRSVQMYFPHEIE